MNLAELRRGRDVGPLGAGRLLLDAKRAAGDEARRRSVPGRAADWTTDGTARHAVNRAEGRCVGGRQYVRGRGLGSEADYRRDADHACDEDGGYPVMADAVEQSMAAAG